MSIEAFEIPARFDPIVEDYHTEPKPGMVEYRLGSYVGYDDYERLLNQYQKVLESIEVVNEVINKGAE